MLREVLRLAVERGTTRGDELARALDTSPELVCLLLAELTRRDMGGGRIHFTNIRGTYISESDNQR